jgi:hypothetical protein
MKDSLATNQIIPTLMQKLGVSDYNIESFSPVIGEGGSEDAVYRKDCGNEYLIILDPLPKGVVLKSHSGVFDANAISLSEQQEVHTGQVVLTNYTATSQTLNLIKVNPTKYS